MNNNSRYLKNYFKHNGVVLICEMLIVLLLSLICSILLDGTPRWLAPTLAVAAYMMAELRFMMAYMAKCVKRDRMLEEQARVAEESEDAELDDSDLPTAEEENAEEAIFAAPIENDEEESPFADEEETEDDIDFPEQEEDDDEDIDPFETDEEDEVSEATPEEDEDIDTFADDEDIRK